MVSLNQWTILLRYKPIISVFKFIYWVKKIKKEKRIKLIINFLLFPIKWNITPLKKFKLKKKQSHKYTVVNVDLIEKIILN